LHHGTEFAEAYAAVPILVSLRVSQIEVKTGLKRG
jgi:hypothetical protein